MSTAWYSAVQDGSTLHERTALRLFFFFRNRRVYYSPRELTSGRRIQWRPFFLGPGDNLPRKIMTKIRSGRSESACVHEAWDALAGDGHHAADRNSPALTAVLYGRSVFVITFRKVIPRTPKIGLERRVSRFSTICGKKSGAKFNYWQSYSNSTGACTKFSMSTKCTAVVGT